MASLLLLSVIMCLEVSDHVAAWVASNVPRSQLTVLSRVFWLGRLSYILCLDHVAWLATSI